MVIPSRGAGLPGVRAALAVSADQGPEDTT